MLLFSLLGISLESNLQSVTNSCRVEVIHYGRRDGQAQLLGVLACVAGATVMTLYRGPVLFSTKSHFIPTTQSLLVGNQSSVLVQLPLGLEMQSWTFGSICLLLNCVSMGVYVNLQVLLFHASLPVSGEIFGHNRLKSQCSQVHPVTYCDHLVSLLM